MGGERRGVRWIVGGFVFCPCHLPLTQAIPGALFAGTTGGIVLRRHAVLLGLLSTAAWLLATWWGFRLLRRSTGCRVEAASIGAERDRVRY